jgi:nucleoside-diphosphate-sugar epimerase
MTRKIFLTGHDGFIGSAIKKRFELNNCDKNDVLGKSKETILQYGYIGKDNKNNWINLLQGTDCVIHCGARTNIKRKTKESLLEIFRKANTEPTKILAEEAAKLGVKRFIFLSSIAVNGTFTYNEKLFTFKDTPMPTEDYGISKWEAEQELWKIAHRTGLEVVIIRSPLVYGFSVKGKFARLIKLLNFGLPLPLSLIKSKRSFIGIDNLVDVINSCIDHPEAGDKTFLVSDGEDLSFVDLIRVITSVMGRAPRLFPFPISILKLIGFVIGKSYEMDRIIGSLQVDIDYTKKILNWSPPISVKEGIRRMIINK